MRESYGLSQLPRDVPASSTNEMLAEGSDMGDMVHLMGREIEHVIEAERPGGLLVTIVKGNAKDRTEEHFVGIPPVKRERKSVRNEGRSRVMEIWLGGLWL